MLKSMTAYARHAQIIGNSQLVWEIRSVNHRYLDAHLRLPESLNGLEPRIRERLSARVVRGRVEIHLSIKQSMDGTDTAVLDPEKLARLAAWQEQIRAVIPDVAPPGVMQILADGEMFGAMESEQRVDEKDLLSSFGTALDELLKRRDSEGQRLQAVLEEKLAGISEITRRLKQAIPAYQQAHQANWKARLDALDTDGLDPLRLHQELALLISKADVTEELDRLESHLGEFRHALHSRKPVGRRLDFLLQEFNREANTLGSKSVHQDISNASVELKVLIDQLREQVQNLE